jgi:organic radical activating enzyme
MEERMPNLLKQIKSIFFDKTQVLAPGLYNYQAPQDSEYHYRLHLRIEPGGEGLLIINASTVLHLNQTATEYAYHLINQTPGPEAIETVVKRYQISFADVTNDYENFMNRIETLINTPDLDPVTYLDFERSTPYIDFPIAPYRLDCAITYQLENREKDGLTPNDRVKRELTFDEWKTILNKAWEAGIPHVIFTGGEPTLRPDLFELIIEAENHGMVTGLSTDGLKLSENKYLEQLLASGLDHLLITFDPENEQSWEAIRDVIPQDIHTTVHLTVNLNDIEKYEKILTDLRSLGVENISLSYQNQNLENILIDLRNKAAEMGFNLDWDLSVPYSQFNPVSTEIETTEPVLSGAGKAWLYIEPDGDTLPAQGFNKVLGNFLVDPWEWIWSNAKLLNKSQ